MKYIFLFILSFFLGAQGVLAQTNIEVEASTEPRYNFVIILISLIFLYSLSSLAVKKKYITIVDHRKIWNIFLLITFLVSAILGIMLVLRINFGWFMDFYAFMLYWHVEFGSAMAIISMFHISWHWRYYVLMLKKNK